MSTCPEKDIHSVYLDDELPGSYVSAYKRHIESCPDCMGRLERLGAASRLLREDSKAIHLDGTGLDSGFERLQTKLRYSCVARRTARASGGLSGFVWMAPAAAALIALAFFVPAKRAGLSQPGQISAVPINIAATALQDGISTVGMPAITRSDDGRIYNTGIYYDTKDIIPSVSFGSEAPLATVDVFRPDFETRNHVSVKITLGSFDQLQRQYGSVPVLVTVGMASDDSQ